MSTVSKRKKGETRDQPQERCPAHLVDELVGNGFKREDVEGWAPERARRVLEKWARRKSHEAARAGAEARRIDGASYPPPMPLRLEAAGAIATALGGTDELELVATLEAGMLQLAPDELSRMASKLIATLRQVPDLPDAGRKVPTATNLPATSADPSPTAATNDTSEEL